MIVSCDKTKLSDILSHSQICDAVPHLMMAYISINTWQIENPIRNALNIPNLPNIPDNNLHTEQYGLLPLGDHKAYGNLFFVAIFQHDNR